jgi:hypothetical protein
MEPSPRLAQIAAYESQSDSQPAVQTGGGDAAQVGSPVAAKSHLTLSLTSAYRLKSMSSF